MLISYLVPIYNVEKYIRKCLDSILCQSGVNFEVVLLDDGSTDNSGEICDEYAQVYPDIVRVIHKENEGLLATRRRGFQEAKGDWFICVDSDDYILENHLQSIVAAIEKYDCDMIMFDYKSIYPDGRIEESGIDITDCQVYEGTKKQELFEKRLLKNKYNNIWSKAIKRSVLDFGTDYKVFGVRNMCEDAIQSYELYSRASKIVFLPQALYMYRRSISSITSNITMDYWHAILVSSELGWKYVNQWGVPRNIVRAYGARCVSDYCNFLAWLLIKSDMGINRKKEIFQKVFLKNKFFDYAVKQYKREYLTTKYLQFRNPILVESIRLCHSWSIAKIFLKIEKYVRGI